MAIEITDEEIDDVIKAAPEGVPLDPAKTQGRPHRALLKKLRDMVLEGITNAAPPVPVTLSAAQTPATTYGGSNGSITVTAGGGDGTFEYSINDTTWQDSNVFTGLPAGARTAYARQKNKISNKSSVAVTVLQAAPVLADAMTVDNGPNKSFNWTNHPDFPTVGAYEYQIGAGAITAVTAKPQPLANAARAIGDVKLRLKAGATHDASAWILNKAALTIWNNATVSLAIDKTTAFVGATETVTLTWGITPNSETVTARQLFYRNAGTSNNWTTLGTQTGTTGTQTYAATISTDFKFEAVTETGTKVSTVRSISFGAAPIVVDYGWYDSDPYTTLNAGTDNLTYAGSVTLANNAADIVADVRQGDGKYLVFRVPSDVSAKGLWSDGTLSGGTYTVDPFNNGTIPDSVVRAPFLRNGKNYYVTRIQASLSQGVNNRFRLN